MRIIKSSIILAGIFLLSCNSSDIDSTSSISSGIESNSSWPYKLSGHLDIIDAAESQSNQDVPGWIIGTITVSGKSEGILVEFKSNAAKNSGYTMDFKYKNPVTLWVNDSVNEYYQVDRVE